MSNEDVSFTSAPERDALAALVARFSADRDAVAASMQRTEAAVHELASRVESLAGRSAEAVTAADLGALRAELARLDAGMQSLREDVARLASVPASTDPLAPAAALGEPSAVEDVRAELRRLAAETATALDDVRRVAEAGSTHANQAVERVSAVDRLARELEAVRTGVGAFRDEVLRRVDEIEARLGVRLDSIVAGVEAESRSVRDGLWERVAEAERRLQEAEALLAGMRVELPQTAAQALESVAGLHESLEEVRQDLGAATARLAALEVPPSSGLSGVLTCVRDEMVAALMMVVSVGAVVGRLTLSLVR